MENYKTCSACGMPLINPEDETDALILDSYSFCVNCVNADGSIKTCQEIFDGGVEFFMQTFPEMGKEMAEKITRKNMLSLPLWQANKNEECLQGAVATDEEFEAVLAKLQG